MAKLKIEGLDKLEKRLRPNATMNDVRRIVRQNGAQLQEKMQEKADFKGHFAWKKGAGRVKVSPTGTTKRSVVIEMLDGGLTAEVGPETEYAPYLEYGTRFMEAQPFVHPALEEQQKKFFSDIKKLVR